MNASRERKLQHHTFLSS